MTACIHQTRACAVVNVGFFVYFCEAKPPDSDGNTLLGLGAWKDELAVRPKRRQGALLRGAAAASRAARWALVAGVGPS